MPAGTGFVNVMVMKIFESDKLNKISEILVEADETVGLAESVTSGLLQLAFSQMKNCTSFYEGGLTAYNIDQKVRHLKIDRNLGEEVNCVSEEIACQMAFGAISMFNTDWGLAITGYATPVPQSGGKCFSYFAIAYKNLIKKSGKFHPKSKDMSDIQVEFAVYLLDEFEKMLKKSQQ